MSEIKLVLTPDEVIIIQEGLLELKAKKSLSTIQKIVAQVRAQTDKINEEKTGDK